MEADADPHGLLVMRHQHLRTSGKQGIGFHHPECGTIINGNYVSIYVMAPPLQYVSSASEASALTSELHLRMSLAKAMTLSALSLGSWPSSRS